MSNVVDLFPKPQDTLVQIGVDGEVYSFPISALEDYVERDGELHPIVLKTIVAVFHDLACEGYFEAE